MSQLEYNITTTWNGEPIDHDPIQLTLAGSEDGEYLELHIEAPFFNDPEAPSGEPGRPFFGLWNYEVVEAFFLNDDNQYVEVEVCPWGQHIVLLLNGQRVTIRHSLPLDVNTTILGDTWTGIARIPVGYLPKNTTKFNAYGIHGSGDNRTYESLYPAPENATSPDFHALEYFNEIDLSELVPGHESEEMSELWDDSIQGLFRYRIQTTWDGKPVDHSPAEITLQGFTGGVEMNISAPFFNDPAPDGEAGKPFYGLWDYEVVEMFFLNDKNEYLEVEVGPWGQHLLLMLKGARNVLKHSLSLDYIVEERKEPYGGQPGTWRGSAMLPPDYFPPNVSRMNAYAIHGTGDNREYQSLYPAPNNNPEYPVPDFHRLELFQPIDFEYQVTNNSEYSQLWKDAINSSASLSTSLLKGEEKMEEVTTEATEVTTDFNFEFLKDEEDEVTVLGIVQTTYSSIDPQDRDELILNKPNPTRISYDEVVPRKHSVEPGDDAQATQHAPVVPSPKPVREGNREIGTETLINQPTAASKFSESSPNLRPLNQESLVSNKKESLSVSVDQTQDQNLEPTTSPFVDDTATIYQFPVKTQGQTFTNSPVEDETQSIPQNIDLQPFQNTEQPQVLQQNTFLVGGTVSGPEQNPSSTQASASQAQDETSHVASVPGSEPSIGEQDVITPTIQEVIQTLSEETPSLPPAHPVCFEQGLIPDSRYCNVFHECVIEDGQWQMYSWRCDRGMIYDPAKVACERSKRRCLRQGTSTRRRRIRYY